MLPRGILPLNMNAEVPFELSNQKDQAVLPPSLGSALASLRTLSCAPGEVEDLPPGAIATNESPGKDIFKPVCRPTRTLFLLFIFISFRRD